MVTIRLRRLTYAQRRPPATAPACSITSTSPSSAGSRERLAQLVGRGDGDRVGDRRVAGQRDERVEVVRDGGAEHGPPSSRMRSPSPSTSCSSWCRPPGARWSTSAAARARSCAASRRTGRRAIGVETGAEPLARARAHAPVGGRALPRGRGPGAAAGRRERRRRAVRAEPAPRARRTLMDAALAEAARVVAPGGAVVVLEPVADGPVLRAGGDRRRRDARARARAGGGRPRRRCRVERELRFDAPVRLASFDALPRPDHARRRRRAPPTFAEREDELRAAYDELAGAGRRARGREPVRGAPAACDRWPP